MSPAVSVERLARMLRLLADDMQGDGPGARSEAIAAEIRRAAADTPPDQRAAFVSDLKAMFPVDDFVDPASLAAGPAGAPAPDADTVEQFAQALGIPAESIDHDRLLELAAMWMHFTLAIDTAVRTVWREISKHASAADLAKAPAPAAIVGVAASYLKGEPRTGPEEMQRQLDLLRRLISGMLMGLADAAKQHAQQHVRVFSPEAIRNSVTPRKLETRETACWRQYELLVDSHHSTDIQAIFGAIQQRLAEYVIQTLASSGGNAARG